MVYLSAFLYFLAIAFAFKAFKSGSKPEQGMAFAFLMAALGTTMISLFAISAFNSL